jgi:hypothetical protein
MRRLCKECRVKESFKDSKEKKLRKGSAFIRAARLKVEELAERERSKGRGLWKLKFSQGRKKAQEAQEEQRQPSDRQENRSGPLISRPGGAQEEPTEGGDRQPSDLI